MVSECWIRALAEERGKKVIWPNVCVLLAVHIVKWLLTLQREEKCVCSSRITYISPWWMGAKVVKSCLKTFFFYLVVSVLQEDPLFSCLKNIFRMRNMIRWHLNTTSQLLFQEPKNFFSHTLAWKWLLLWLTCREKKVLNGFHRPWGDETYLTYSFESKNEMRDLTRNNL